MPLLHRKVQLAAVVEAVEGTRQAVVVGDMLHIFEPEFSPEIEMAVDLLGVGFVRWAICDLI